jgi:hypothetical protein
MDDLVGDERGEEGHQGEQDDEEQRAERDVVLPETGPEQLGG